MSSTSPQLAISKDIIAWFIIMWRSPVWLLGCYELIVYIRCFVIIPGLPEINDVIQIQRINRKLDCDIFQLRYATYYCSVEEFSIMIILISHHTIWCALVVGYFGNIGIDTNIEAIVVSLTTWEAHHSPRATPEGCGELPRSLMRQQWPKLRYQFLFYHDEIKLMMNKQILLI